MSFRRFGLDSDVFRVRFGRQVPPVRFFYVADQVVLAAEALRAKLAEEVAHAGVDHQVAPYVLFREELSAAVFAREFFLVRIFDGATSRVDF